MRVCILTTSFPRFKGDGTGNFVLNLVEELSKKLTVDVVAPFYSKRKLNYKFPNNLSLHRFSFFLPRSLQKLNDDGGIPHSIRVSFLAKIQLPIFMLSFFIKSLSVSKKSDIIHAQWTLSAFIGIFVSKVRKIPLIVTIRGDDMNLALKHKFTRNIFEYILRNCDYITANNLQQAETIRGMGFTNVIAVPNGVDTDLFKPRNKDLSRRKLGIPKDKNVILFIGWLIKRKGINYLIDAFSKLNLTNKLLLLIGDGTEKKNLLHQVEQRNLRKEVSFLGNVEHEHIPDYINSADVFVLPSLREGRPNVVAEAMACNKPVIATDVGGTKELIINNKTGILIKPKNKETIVKAIEQILSDKNLRGNLESNSRKFILDNKLSWKGCADSYLEIYKNLIKI